MLLHDIYKALGTQQNREAYVCTLCRTSYVRRSRPLTPLNQQPWQKRYLVMFIASVSQSLASQTNLLEPGRPRRSHWVQSRAVGVHLPGLLLIPSETLGA